MLSSFLTNFYEKFNIKLDDKTGAMIKHIILNEKDTIHPVDYSTFELSEIYKDYYND